MPIVERTSFPDEAHLRVDAWVAKYYPDVPKRQLRKWLDEGALRMNGVRCSKGDRIVGGAKYQLMYEPIAAALAPNPSIALDVLYEDDALIAVNKPAALDCQPNRPEETDTLGNALLARWPALEGVGESPLTCGVLHRIDGDTSGMVLVAKTQQVYEQMRAQFAAHTVEKHYRALVCGSVVTAMRLEHYLAHNPRCPGRMVDAAVWRDVKRPMRAVTSYRPLHPVKVGALPCTLLDVCIFTGVTHQIRAQLSLAGLPILGDRRYGGQQKQMPFPRHFLHAYTIAFTHPLSNEPKLLKAPLTEDFQRVLGHQPN